MLVPHLVLLGLGLRRLPGPPPQQIPQLLVVDLEHARLHLEGPPLLLQTLAALKDLPHGPRDHARLVRGAQHRVRLATASLIKGGGSGGRCDESLRLYLRSSLVQMANPTHMHIGFKGQPVMWEYTSPEEPRPPQEGPLSQE